MPTRARRYLAVRRANTPVMAASLITLLMITASDEADAAPWFRAPYMSFDVESTPHSVAVADFDGDGDPDLAVANALSYSISIFHGNGDGTFRPAGRLTTGPNVHGVRAADFDSDGNLELAVACDGDSAISLFRGRGDGTFDPRVAFHAGHRPTALAIADLNGDGWLDVVSTGGRTSRLLGNGDGTLGPPLDLGPASFPAALALADVNGDGAQDLAVTESSDIEDPELNRVLLMLGNGDGTFRDMARCLTGNQPVALEFGDLDADGDLDLAVACHSEWARPIITLLMGNGDGTFRSGGDLATGSGPQAIVVADLDADGKLDLATSNSHGDPDFYRPSVALLRGKGDGTFHSPVHVSAGGHPHALAAAYLDGDEKLDLVVTNDYERTVSALLGNGDLTFGHTSLTPVTTGSPWAMASADLDEDGFTDLAVAGTTSNAVSVLHGSGNGLFTSLGTPGTGDDPRAVGVSDFDQDGHADLAVANYLSGTVSILLGDGAGSFPTRAGFATGIGPYWMTIADVNADVHSDLIVGYLTLPPANLSVFWGTGDGTFGRRTDLAVAGHGGMAAAADLNADGRADLVGVSNAEGQHMVWVRLSTSDDFFTPPREHPVGSSALSVAIGEFDGDGVPDLAVGTSSAVVVLRGLGDGTFAQCVIVAPGAWSVRIADLDRDGRQDLLMLRGDEYAGEVGVQRGNGNGTFAPPVWFGCGGEPASLLVDDWNADGVPDLMVANVYGRTVTTLQGQADRPPISPERLEATLGLAVLRWTGAGAGSLDAKVERRAMGSSWVDLGRPTPEGLDALRFEDHSVAAGVRYSYRLTYMDGVRERSTADIEVLIPQPLRLSLGGFSPNPIVGSPRVAFTLVDDSPATLELLDVAGRRVASRSVNAVGAGRHVLGFDPGPQLAPGLYLVRLRHGDQVLVARGVVTR